MKPLFLLLAFACFLAALGCRQEAAPPAPLAAEQMPAALEKEFLKATAEARELVAQIKIALQGKDYTSAYQLVQILGGLSGNTREQQALVVRANQTLYGLVQTAQSQGDQQAAAAVSQYKATK